MKNSLNSKGFSYIEMIIVLAIMGIMVGMVTMSIGTIGRNNVLRTSEKLESLVNKARTNALTKGTANGCLNIVKLDDGKVYAYVGKSIDVIDDDTTALIKKEGEVVCSGDIIVNVDASSTESGSICQVFFKQSTGGLDKATNSTIMVKKNNKSATFTILNATGKIKR